MDDANVLHRQAAYLDTIRGLYRRERQAGFVACLVGVLVMLWARFGGAAPAWALWAGVAIIAAGWMLFVYVILRRTAWVRAHPFDPNG